MAAETCSAAARSLQTADNITWTLSGLSGPTAADGVYTLTLVAAGSGIKNVAADVAARGRLGRLAEGHPGPDGRHRRRGPRSARRGRQHVDLVFSEPVAGLDVGDLVLTRDGGANLLTGAESLDTADNITWTLRGLGGLTGTPGGFVAFNDHIAGPATHPNATAYAGNAVASGLLKDIQTGLDTGVTLTITERRGRLRQPELEPAGRQGPTRSIPSTDSSISRRPTATASRSRGPIPTPTPSPAWTPAI